MILNRFIRGRISRRSFLPQLRLLQCLALVYASGLSTSSVALELVDPMQRPAQRIDAKAKPVILDIERAGERLVAVGERGIILVSDDSGKSWEQSDVPVSVTLTAVRFVDPLNGWAVGHSGVILHSDDAGDTWAMQLDGRAAAELVLKQAQTEAGGGDDAQRRLTLAKRMVDDGPDKPFLAIEFEGSTTGLAVGAYGLAFHTKDGGKTWKPWQDRIPNSRGMHIYAVQRVGHHWVLAGEQGFFARSSDSGDSYESIETPYRGSYFTLLAADAQRVLLGGLRGHAYYFDLETELFEKIKVPIPISLAASTKLPDGRQLFINQSGQWLINQDDTLTPVAAPPGAPSNAVVLATDGTLAVATWNGVTRYALPTVVSADNPN